VSLQQKYFQKVSLSSPGSFWKYVACQVCQEQCVHFVPNQTSCAACSAADMICPASGDLNSHPELSACLLDIDVSVKYISCAAPKFQLPWKRFDLSTSKWGHGSPVSFLPIFSLLSPSILDLGWGTGRTDRQTTAVNALCATLWRGYNKDQTINQRLSRGNVKSL